jgi:hypothetical protein
MIGKSVLREDVGFHHEAWPVGARFAKLRAWGGGGSGGGSKYPGSPGGAGASACYIEKWLQRPIKGSRAVRSISVTIRMGYGVLVVAAVVSLRRTRQRAGTVVPVVCRLVMLTSTLGVAWEMLRNRGLFHEAPIALALVVAAHVMGNRV